MPKRQKNKAKKQNRLIFGTVINQNVFVQSDDFIHAVSACFLGVAWATKKVIAKNDSPSNTNFLAFVQSNREKTVLMEGFAIEFVPMERLLKGIKHFQEQYAEKKQSRKKLDYSGLEQPTAMVGIGSKEFCENWIQYWANQPGELPAWARKMISTVQKSENGATTWIDFPSSVKVHTSNIFSMHRQFADALKEANHGT